MAYYGAPAPAPGWNPQFGHDQGQPPSRGMARNIYGAGPMAQPAPYSWGAGVSGAAGYQHMYPAQQQLQYGQPYSSAYGIGVGSGGTQQAAFTYLSGFGGGNRHPQPHPMIDPSMPALNMTNSTGGVGCEPGYNYFFPPEHTKIQVLKSGSTPPWQLPPNFTVPFHACHVPVNTTVGDLLKGFGATNPVPKKNKVFEVVQGGNGKWYKGLSFNGENEKDMGRTLKDLGWDKSRSGMPGGKPVVYLYITKD